MRPSVSNDDDGKDHRRGAYDSRSDQHGFGGGLEGIAGPIVFFQQLLGLFEVDVKPVILFDLLLYTSGICSISESSKTDWALSVTGP